MATSTRTPPTMALRREFLTPVHGAVNVAHVLVTHALLVGWLVVAFRLLPLALAVPLALLGCVVHQRAMSEWIHEGAHYNLVPNRRWNDRLTDLLAGVWFALPVRSYRATHFAHHRKQAFFVPDDPDTAFLELHSRRAFWRAVLRDLSGLTILRQFRRFESSQTDHGQELRARIAAVVVHGAVLTLAFRAGLLAAPIVYYVSLAILYPLLNRLRTYAQHVTIEASGRSRFVGSDTSRTIDGGLVDHIVHTSPRLLYHHEHHLHPHLPYRALRHLLAPVGDVNRFSRSRWQVLGAIYRGLPQSA